MPGATCEAVDGDEIKGRIKVKVGPIQMTYAGTARFTEIDQAAGVVVLTASGKETRGAGTASATVRSELTADGDATKVTVHTTLNVTGKPAQFGRGVMAEVGGRLIGIFADNLASMLAAGAPPTAVAAANGKAAKSTTSAQPTERAEPADPDGLAEPAEPGALAEPAEPGALAESAELTVSVETASEEELPIDVLNLNTRAWSSLRRDGIQTLADLTRRSGAQLLAIDGVGPASLADIRSRLTERGLALADAATETEPEPAERDAELADVTPLRKSRADAPEPAAGMPARERVSDAPAWQPRDNEALDLLDVAGLPVLKRAVPAAAALLAILFVVFGLRRRRARRR
jgi:carbon monoxide dehydrogenase subunit G